jgi:glycosyltransferase involved in cell wall biosynthesis
MESVCIRSENWFIDQKTADNINMEFVYIISRFDFSWIGKIRRIIKKKKPDLILTYGFNGNFAAVLSSLGLGVDIISSWHGKYKGTGLIQIVLSPFINLLSNFLMCFFVKNIVTVSDYSKKKLIKGFVSKNKIKRIYNGIAPLPEVCFINKKKIKKENKIVVGTACRLDSTKDLATFLKAMKIIFNKNPDIFFIIWGDGPLKKDLENFAKELKISDNVKFMGYESKIYKKLPLLDIFVLSSVLENFSLALLEAMRAGLSIIATNVGGNPEAVLHNRDAILLSPKKPNLLANTILTLAENKELRLKIAKFAKKRFNELFTEDKMILETAKWLEDCKLNN